MSVAEALNEKNRTPGTGSQRSKYYAGLKLDDVWTYTADDAHTRRNETGNAYSGNVDYTGAHPSQQSFNDARKLNQYNSDRVHRLTKTHVGGKTEGLEEAMIHEDPWTAVFRDPQIQSHGGSMGDSMSGSVRETDLFLDTLGGPGGTVVRQNGHPPLSDPHFYRQQQQQFQRRQLNTGSDGLLVQGGPENAISSDRISGSRRASRQHRRPEAHGERDHKKHNRGGQGTDNMLSYASSEMRAGSKLSEGQSLDLESSKGGAGAPVRDPWGKHVTRMPITLSRDDLGESTITEDIPGKATFDLDFTNEENKPYYPWGSQGGGAPIRNRDGNVITQVFGKLEERNGTDGEARRNKRRQEVLYNELKECARQQQENRDELNRYMKAPQAELAELLLAGRVGKPKRDEITGEVGYQQHLSNSDVSRWKMNYQPVPLSEKRRYHDELVKMAEERQLQKQLEKLKEKQESNAHFQYMDSTWGGFGGGAPKHHLIRKKVNLTKSLFYPHELQEPQRDDSDYMPRTGLGSFENQQHPNRGYQRPFPDEESFRQPPSPLSFPAHRKAAARSSHKNQYDTSADNTSPDLSGITVYTGRVVQSCPPTLVTAKCC